MSSLSDRIVLHPKKFEKARRLTELARYIKG